MLTVDNVSQRTSQLLAQITRREIEGDSKENRKTEFGDYNGDFVYEFSL